MKKFLALCFCMSFIPASCMNHLSQESNPQRISVSIAPVTESTSENVSSNSAQYVTLEEYNKLSENYNKLSKEIIRIREGQQEIIRTHESQKECNRWRGCCFGLFSCVTVVLGSIAMSVANRARGMANSSYSTAYDARRIAESARSYCSHCR